MFNPRIFREFRIYCRYTIVEVENFATFETSIPSFTTYSSALAIYTGRKIMIAPKGVFEGGVGAQGRHVVYNIEDLCPQKLQALTLPPLPLDREIYIVSMYVIFLMAGKIIVKYYVHVRHTQKKNLCSIFD